MSTTSFKCPNCGAAITYVPGTEHTKCPYCLSAHTLDALIAKQKKKQQKRSNPRFKSESLKSTKVRCASIFATVVERGGNG